MICGVVAAVPKRIERNWDESLIKATGVQERRVVGPEQDVFTLAESACRSLLSLVGWGASDVEAIIFVTQTSPVRMPDAGSILAGRLGFSGPAFSLQQACSGYVAGLNLCHKIVGNTLLVAGDTVSRMIRERDDSNRQLFGDCVTASAIESKKGASCAPPMHWVLGTDGTGWAHLKADPCINMDGGEVMTFALKTVPKLVADVTMGARVEWYLFHQANAGLLRHVIRKSKLAPEKCPINIESFGNTSSASIPLLMCASAATPSLKGLRNRVAMFGFGAGLSWAGVLLELEPLVCAELIQV